MRRYACIAGLLVGCATRTTSEPVDTVAQAIELPSPNDSGPVIPDAVATEPQHDPAPPPEPVDEGRPIIVAGDKGVLELSIEGETTRVLSTTPGRSPRWISGGRQIVFVALEGGRSRELRRIDLASATEDVVAPVEFGPPCKPNEWQRDDPDWEPEPLELTNEDELWAAADGRHVCMVAADHSADLRDIAELHIFDLDKGSVERLLFMAMPECGRGPETLMPERCERPSSDEDADPDWDEPPSAAIGGFIDSTSPDGTWQLVALASALGDVLHAQYALVEVSSGKSFPVGASAGAWPKSRVPPKAEALEHGEGEWVDGWPDVAGGATAQWVGPHHLVVGRQLIVAGVEVVELPGDLAL